MLDLGRRNTRLICNYLRSLRLNLFLPPIAGLLLFQVLLYTRFVANRSSLNEPHPSKMALIVVAPTFYSSRDEARYLLGLEACQNAARHQIHLLLVDASPTNDIAEGLQNAGLGYVQVMKQTAIGRKGAALREAIQLAYEEANTGNPSVVIGFQELEKVDMFRHWPSLVKHMMETSADVTVPRRADSSFRVYYPIEQYHCESFANLYLDSLAAKIGLPSIDWTMGPVAFRYQYAKHWLDFPGEMWDAQLVPLVYAYLAGAKVTSYTIDYLHPKEMKEEEEGVFIWNEKRLIQLNFLKDTVGKAITESKPTKQHERSIAL